MIDYREILRLDSLGYNQTVSSNRWGSAPDPGV